MVDFGIRVERTYDASLIQSLAAHPEIFPFVSDDYSPSPESWKPVMAEMVVNLVGQDREGCFGFGIFIPRNHACYDAHIGFLPRARRHGEALKCFRRMLDWMWHESKAARIVGEVDSRNRRAILFALQAGFVIYGVNRKSKLVGGILRDQVCLGISRG